MQQKTCCFPGCRTTVLKGFLACTPHWRLVDAEHQREARYRLHAWRGDNGLRGNEPAAREFLTNFFKQKIQKGDRL